MAAEELQKLMNRETQYLPVVARAAADLGPLKAGGRILVAVSGGMDSMALLHALDDAGYAAGVAHFDHQTRSGASAEDAAFVREVCRRLGAPFFLECRAVEAEARAAGLSFEAHARRVRYDFLLRTAKEAGYGVIATGHHADDQAETVLMRVLTGCGLDGLTGIAPVRAEDGIRIIRPQLGVPRAVIAAWMRAAGHGWREDASNADTVFPRNFVRHELLPLITEKLNPRAAAALCRLADLARVDREALDEYARQETAAVFTPEKGIDRRLFGALPEALRRRVLRGLCWRHGSDPDSERLIAAVDFVLEAGTGRQHTLPGGAMLYAGRQKVRFLTPEGETQPEEAPLAAGGTHAFGRLFHVQYAREAPAPDLRRWSAPSRQAFDADAVEGPLRVRGRLPGDAFTPLGMRGTRKIQAYYTDEGIPAPDRDRHPLIVDDDGILWVTGHAAAARAAVTRETRNFLVIEVSDDDAAV
jgi:tRNA(Ile)-lysidine synthase